MRSISSDLEQAIKNPSMRMVAKAKIDPSRTVFTSLLDDNPYDAGDYSATTDDPVGQCMIYSPTLDKVITFIVDSTSGSIYGMEQGSGTTNDLSLSANADTKPAAYCLKNGTAYLWYWDTTNGLTRVLVDLSTWGTSGSTIIGVGNLEGRWTITAGSPHALSETQIVLTYQTSLGGIGVGYYDGDWSHWHGRFISTGGLTETDWTIYSAAVLFEDRVFVYLTDMNKGYVRGVKFNPYKGLWTDSFEAMPADLSRFCILNAVNAGGYIHIAGQFHRTEDWSSAKVYSLVVRSLDGYTFSWDRFTLLSTLGYQFQIATRKGEGVNYVYASDRNSVGRAEASHFFVSTPNSSVTLEPPSDLISVSINSAKEATLDIRAHDEELYDEEVIRKNSRVILYLGYQTNSGYEYVKYQSYIISDRSVAFTGESRSLVLSLVDQATWKTSQIAFPFYAEILSKTSFADDCNKQDHTYPVKTISPYMPDYLILDFWNNLKWDGDGSVPNGDDDFHFRSGESGWGTAYKVVNMDSGDTDKKKFRTIDLDEYYLLDEYPTVRAGGEFDVRLYGWDTTAYFTRNPDDYTDTETHEYPDRPASSWRCYVVTAPADNPDNKTVTEGNLTSTYDKFPKEFPDNEDGSYPITFNFTGLSEDHAILYFGLTIDNNTAGYSTICPERMEIEGIDFIYSGAGSSQAWDTENPDSDVYDRSYLKYPTHGLPSLLFSTRPYSAFNFRVNADFIYEEGDDPISVGRTCWGVLGLAEDGRHYIVARYHKQKTQVELILVRSYRETELATYSVSGVESVMLDHRDGRFRVWYRTSTTTWQGPVIDYQYDEITHGKISMSDTDVMHTGVYAAVAPPGFLTPSFNMQKSDGIGIVASSEDSVLDAFPSSGKFVINEKVYSYGSKTPRIDSYIGPYQGRRRLQDYWKTYREDGVTYEGHGVEVTAWFPDSDPYRFQNLLLAADRGRTWLITKSDWEVQDTTSGVSKTLPNRSRHYCPTLEGRSPISQDMKVNFVPGLLEIEPEGTEETGYHLYGSWVTLYGTDQIWLKNVEANTVTRDATVKDMVSMLCKSASIEASFSGDTNISSLPLSTTAAELVTDDPYMPGGFDVHFSIPALNDGDWIALYADNLYIGDEANQEQIDLGIKNNGGTLQVFSKPQDAIEPDEYINLDMPVQAYDVRILFHGTFCSIYLDDLWVATFAYAEEDENCPACDDKIITWPDQQIKLYLHSNTSGYTATDILVTELFDWREAIYVESEQDAASALQSVIQERPIENTPTSDGGVDWSYFLDRDLVEILPSDSKKMSIRHSRRETTGKGAGSDAIVMYLDVEFATNENFAINEGFLTKVLKLSTLETGARKSGIIVLRKAWEHQFQHDVIMVPDVRLEVGDRLFVGYILPGTGRYEQHNMIVDDISIHLEEGDYEMSVRGHRSTQQTLRARASGYLEGV